MEKQQNFKFNENSLKSVINQYNADPSWLKLQPPVSSPLSAYDFNDNNNYSQVQSKPLTTVDVPLVHTNMTPSFGSTIKQNTNIENVRADNKLDLYTGQFRNNWEHKQETGNLFSPTPQNLSSFEVPRDEDVIDRINRSCTIRNGEKPIEQVRVARGLNQGFTDKGSGGFHETFRYLPKTTDELNVNPRASFKNKMIAGKDPIDKRVSGQYVNVNKAHVIVNNENGQFNNPQPTDVIAPRINGNVVLNTTNRRNITYKVGSAEPTNGGKQLPCPRRPKIKKSFKTETEKEQFGNYENTTGSKNPDGSILKNKYRETKRQETLLDYVAHGLIGILSPDEKKMPVPSKNKPKEIKMKIENNRENAIDAKQSQGNYIKNDQPIRTTLKETTEINNNNKANINPIRKCQIVYDPSDVPETTGRETIENNNYGKANVNPMRKGQIVYDPSDVPETTGRETI